MKIFNKTDAWDSKVNFVDDNNVYLGFDVAQKCCEYAGWFISDREVNSYGIPRRVSIGKIDTIMEAGGIIDLKGWNFDINYFQEHEDAALQYRARENDAPRLDMGKMVIFRIVKDGEEMFIHLFNCHTGYYSHGFELKTNSDSIKKESI